MQQVLDEGDVLLGDLELVLQTVPDVALLSAQVPRLLILRACLTEVLEVLLPVALPSGTQDGAARRRTP